MELKRDGMSGLYGAVKTKMPKECLIFALLTLLTISSLPPSVSASPRVEILSHTGYLDSIGLYHVVGEVRNTGSVDLFVQVTGHFYDSANSSIASVTSPTTINVLLAGRKGPFEIILCTSSDIFMCQQQSASVHHYNLTPTFETYPGTLPLELEILSYSSFLEAGWMSITGQIKNNAAGSAFSTRVVATYYDSNGGVVATAFSATSPAPNIGPGEQATFEVRLSPDRTPYVTHYTLAAESSGYGMISRSPFGTVLALEGSPAVLGSQLNLVVILKDENRNPISSSPVEFYVFEDASWRWIGSSVTGATGQAGTSYLPNALGRFLFNATYTGSIGHSRSSDTIELIVSPPPVSGPDASFTISPATGDVTTTFTMDASSSSDPEDSFSYLQFRWDWEDDGVWDTSWYSASTAQHQYFNPGTYTVRLEVRNTKGLTGDTTSQVVVSSLRTGPNPYGPSILAFAILGPVFLIIFLYLLRNRRTKTIPPWNKPQ